MSDKIKNILILATKYENSCLNKSGSGVVGAAMFVIPLVGSVMEKLFDAFEGSDIPNIIGHPNTNLWDSTYDNSLLTNLERYQKTEPNNQYKKDIDDYIGICQSMYNSYTYIIQNKNSPKTPEIAKNLLSQIDWFLKNAESAINKGSSIISMIDSMKGAGNKMLEFLQEWKLNFTYESLTTNIKKLIPKLMDALSREIPSIQKLKIELESALKEQATSQTISKDIKPSTIDDLANIKI